MKDTSGLGGIELMSGSRLELRDISTLAIELGGSTMLGVDDSTLHVVLEDDTALGVILEEGTTVGIKLKDDGALSEYWDGTANPFSSTGVVSTIFFIINERVFWSS